MEGVIAAIILTAIAVGVILTVYVGKRNRAKQTLLVDKPTQKKSAEWKASQKYVLVSFLISSLNKLQEIENKSILCRELILWHENRMNALKFLRRKGELQKESEAIGLVQGDLLELNKERESLLSKFENIVPRTGDKSIATVDDVKGFSCVNGDVLTELLRNPKSCKSNNGNRILFCANFYVYQKGNCITIEPYYNLTVKETYELQSLGYGSSLARDDEVAKIRYLHERKNGGPDRRFTYNPTAYIVYRGIVNLIFDGIEGNPIKFSNRAKAHSLFEVFKSLAEKAATRSNRRVYVKMLTMDKLCSATEVIDIIKAEDLAEKSRQEQIEQEEKIRQQNLAQEKEEQDKQEAHQMNVELEQGIEEEWRDFVIVKEDEGMKTQPVWNQYEAALLLEGYLDITNGANKKEVAERISKMLRQMATNVGLKIDEIYRNVNGITLQMDRMRMAMTGQIEEKRKPAKVFLDIVAMYKTDMKNFEKVLEDAKAKCEIGDKDSDELVVKVELPMQIEAVEDEDKNRAQKVQKQEEQGIRIYDYETTTSLSFTKPILVVYFGEINSRVQSWRDVYTSILYSLSQDYPSIIKGLAENPEFTTVSYNKQSLRQAMEVTSSLFAEGNRSASELGRAIGQLLDLCHVDHNNVIIRYSLSNQQETSSKSEVGSQATSEVEVKVSENNTETVADLISALDNEIYEVVKTRYTNGFLVGAINFKKIRRYYEEMFSKELTVDNSAIEESLKKTCIFLDEKFYAIDALMSENLKSNVLEFIQDGIESNGYVYYKMIMENFGYELTAHIPDIELLKKCLSRLFHQYVYFEEYIANDANVKIDATKEVEQVLLDAVYPISFDRICALLPHLTEEAIRKVVIFDDKIIVTNNNDRFHIDSMGLTENDVKEIEEIISNALKDHNCMFGNELLKGIERQMPALYESLKEFGDRGIRGAVAYELKNQFKFNSNIICNIGADIDNAEVFRSFAETERYFTLASLINLKEQIGIGNIYFDNVNEVASRINVKDYVPNNALVFNVDEIDALLERIIIGNMASIKEASNFAIYPSTCYPWTEYLLESYVAKYSQKFSLLHICYAESKCAGAIVKRSSQIDSMDAVVVEYLVIHPEIQSGNEALNGLVEDGYIARKRYKNIEDLLVVAKAKRRV